VGILQGTELGVRLFKCGDIHVRRLAFLASPHVVFFLICYLTGSSKFFLSLLTALTDVGCVRSLQNEYISYCCESIFEVAKVCMTFGLFKGRWYEYSYAPIHIYLCSVY
jgi:hypothetical protein